MARGADRCFAGDFRNEICRSALISARLGSCSIVVPFSARRGCHRCPFVVVSLGGSGAGTSVHDLRHDVASIEDDGDTTRTPVFNAVATGSLSEWVAMFTLSAPEHKLRARIPDIPGILALVMPPKIRCRSTSRTSRKVLAHVSECEKAR